MLADSVSQEFGESGSVCVSHLVAVLCWLGLWSSDSSIGLEHSTSIASKVVPTIGWRPQFFMWATPWRHWSIHMMW